MQIYYFTELEDNLPQGYRYTLSEELCHHLLVVLRHGVGDSVMVCNGRGWLYGSKIETASKKRVEMVIESVEANFGSQQRRDITLAICPTKNIERTEWAVEKMVEIGVTRIVPILSAHSERKNLKTERLRRIAVSAAGQSLKGFMPTIEELTPFKKFVEENPEGYIAHCNEGKKTKIHRDEARYTVMIGPEGDFSTEEVAFALQHNYREVTLGDARLRTETAAVCAAYLCTLEVPIN